MNDLVVDLILWLLASPVYFVRWLVWLTRRWRFFRIAYAPSLICRNCGETIWLVGIWRCGCGYTYKGHVLRECPVCGSLPRMARCYGCGVTEKLPES